MMRELLVEQVCVPLDLQFFSSSEWWYDEFVKSVKESPYKEDTMKIIKKIDKTPYAPTKKRIKTLQKEIDKALIPEGFKKNLLRKVKIFETRTSRGVPEGFGGLLRHLRESKGLTLRELSKRSNVAPSYIQRLETGEKNSPSQGIINNLSEALGQDLMETLIGAKVNVQEYPSLPEMIIANDFLLGTKNATSDDKEALLDILRIVFYESFTEYPKGQENMMSLSNKIIEFQKSINSRKEDEDTL